MANSVSGSVVNETRRGKKVAHTASIEMTVHVNVIGNLFLLPFLNALYENGIGSKTIREVIEKIIRILIYTGNWSRLSPLLVRQFLDRPPTELI